MESKLGGGGGGGGGRELERERGGRTCIHTWWTSIMNHV